MKRNPQNNLTDTILKGKVSTSTVLSSGSGNELENRKSPNVCENVCPRRRRSKFHLETCCTMLLFAISFAMNIMR